MQVTVQVEGHLRQYFPALATPHAVTVQGALTVADVLAAVGVPAELPAAVLCNKARVEIHHAVRDGDALVLLSPLAGG